MKLDARLTLFMTLVGVFLTSLLLGNLIAGKVTGIPLGGAELAMSVGGIPFPLTFVLTDILNEFYGKRVVRRVTFLGFAMTAMAFVMIHVAAAMPWLSGADQPDWKGLPPSAWNSVFTGATQIQIASMIAYLTSQLLDISVFFAIKRWTGNRLLWLRATGSTVISQGIDTVLVTVIGFGGTMSNDVLLEMIGTAYLVKLAVAIGMTPVIYALHALIERTWGMKPVPTSDTSESGGDGGSASAT
jgi:uncharacterized integral membrane protein (TIGR00697 family)